MRLTYSVLANALRSLGRKPEPAGPEPAFPMLTMQPVPPGSESFATCVTYLTERLAAEAVGPRVRCPWSWPSLCLPVGRKRAELLHQGEEVRHAPVLGDLAVVHPHGIDGVEVDLAAGRG